MSRVVIGLALGGGAARGLAHLGLIEVLRRDGVPIDLVAGTSMGALVGGAFCRDGTIEPVMADAVTYLRSPSFKAARIHRLRRNAEETQASMLDTVSQYIARGRAIAQTVTRPSVLEAADLYEVLAAFVDDRDIRSLKVPFRAVTTDIVTGEQVVVDRGSLIDAVAASSAVPGAFPAVPLGKRLCVDGGIRNMVPVTVARAMGADYVIAANVIHELPMLEGDTRALEIYFRTHQITKRALTELQLEFADTVITPQVGHIHWADFTRADDLIEAGRRAARDALPAIRRDLARLRRLPRFLRRHKRWPHA
ncbi:MAG: patatin-like phospholipase family protein [Deltaproteobacteria bacterium]|nr:patatin-like phospholipase family protein [Deltaproteobacteria bacterium]